jgi:hypothetical protein
MQGGISIFRPFTIYIHISVGRVAIKI